MTLIKGFWEGLEPMKQISPSQWADEFRYLSSVSSAEAGRWRTSRTPYLREIMDRFSPYDETQEIIIMKGAQLGLTEMGYNLIGYCIDVDPGPIMNVMPSLDTVKRNSKMRLDPMIRATPRLSKKIRASKSRDSGNTMFQKDFPGGTLILSGANSASSLRSVPIRFLILDETDAFPLDLEGEGSPVDLAKARTRTFSRKKILFISTPTIEGSSVIEREFKTTCQKYFFLPCPHCGTMQILSWPRIIWEEGNPFSARYQCEGCDKMIDEKEKPFMLKNGRWISTMPENESPRRVGYHINSLYSPLGWYSWGQAADDFLKAKKDREKLKVFINTVLGETWKEEALVPPWEDLFNNKSDYPINTPPVNVGIITAGVDVQKDRIEIEIVGWSEGLISYSIDYRVLHGDTSSNQVWDGLAKVVNETWIREDKVVLPLSKMAVDTGYNTTEVYKFCQRFHITQVIPVKGQDSLPLVYSAPRAVNKTVKGKKIGSLGLFNVGVSVIKSQVYGYLNLKLDGDGRPKPGHCFFPAEYSQEYFKMLTAEELQFRFVKGYKVWEWVKKRERNEALDCRVYARAAAAVHGIDRWKPEDWASIIFSYQTETKTFKRKQKSDFWK